MQLSRVTYALISAGIGAGPSTNGPHQCRIGLAHAGGCVNQSGCAVGAGLPDLGLKGERRPAFGGEPRACRCETT